jgi:hypothetical protein
MRYWATQIAVSAFFAIALPVTGVVLIMLKPDEGGMGLIVFLAGVAFSACTIWLLTRFFSFTTQQRAIYGWVLNQQRAQTTGHATVSAAARTGRVAMSIAERAARGQAGRSELVALQKLRPEIPHPGELPVD